MYGNNIMSVLIEKEDAEKKYENIEDDKIKEIMKELIHFCI
jgi:hypothetical protein